MAETIDVETRSFKERAKAKVAIAWEKTKKVLTDPATWLTLGAVVIFVGVPVSREIRLNTEANNKRRALKAAEEERATVWDPKTGVHIRCSRPLSGREVSQMLDLEAEGYTRAEALEKMNLI